MTELGHSRRYCEVCSLVYYPEHRTFVQFLDAHDPGLVSRGGQNGVARLHGYPRSTGLAHVVWLSGPIPRSRFCPSNHLLGAKDLVHSGLSVPPASHGLSSATLTSSKSVTLRVTTVRP